MNPMRKFGPIIVLAASIAWLPPGRPSSGSQDGNGEELRRVKTVVEKAIEEDPGNSELWIHLGLVHRKRNELDQAVKAFERAAELNPRSANAFFMLGLIHEKRKARDKAIAAWEACLANAQEERMREIADKHIRHLRGQP